MKTTISLVAVLAAAFALPAAAHDDGADETRLTPAVLAQIAQARRATARFHDIDAAIAAGYGPLSFADKDGITCIANGSAGAMGIHYVNGGLLTPYLSPLAPQSMIYEPLADGSLRLVGAEYIVFKSAWDGAFPGKVPRLFERDFHLVPAGNRYGLPPFYALHLWLWQPNRSGLFADWNPSVRCP